MKNLELNLGMLCNNKCVFCMSGEAREGERHWLPLEKAKEELDHFYEEGCRSLGFLGGEPTAHPKILECVRYAAELGYERIALCSNGTRFGKTGFVDQVLEAGVTRVGVSIHSHLAEVEDELTGVPGNFAKKLRGLRYLLEQKKAGRLPDNVSLNPVLSKRTLPLMEGYIAFFREEGFDDIRFNYIWPQSKVAGDKEMIPAYKEAMPAILRVILRSEAQGGMHLTFGGVPRCMLRWGGAPLSKDLSEHIGRKYLSEGDDLPTDVSLRGEERFNWQERKRDMLKTHAEACARCRYMKVCDGVWKSYADLYGLKELTAVR